MMHGRGKSDEAVVARKPANEAERSAAEPVERRAEAKGNVNQQSASRTQSRADASQALERVRQAARERKEERFTALLHHITPDLLGQAFDELKQNAAPGVDGVRWKDYEQDLERKLEDLHARVHRGAYRALPSRRQYIPKADGRQRPIAVGTVTSNCTSAPLSADLILDQTHRFQFASRRVPILWILRREIAPELATAISS